MLLFFFLLEYFCIGLLRCCGSCPFASLLAFVFTLTGTSVFCGCLYYPIRASIEQINDAFQIEYIDFEWYGNIFLTSRPICYFFPRKGFVHYVWQLFLFLQLWEASH